MAANQLELRIHNVKCIDETGGNRVTEWGSDDIYLGGTAVLMKGPIPTVVKIPYFKVGQFDDGDRKTYSPPKPFTEFSLRNSGSFPRNYAVSLVLVEKDSGDQMNEFLNDLAEKQQEAIIKTYRKAAASGQEPETEEFWDMVWKEAKDIAKEMLMEWWRSVRKDDIFEPGDASIKVTSVNQTWNGKPNSPVSKLTYKGHNAHYEIAYDWYLAA